MNILLPSLIALLASTAIRPALADEPNNCRPPLQLSALPESDNAEQHLARGETYQNNGDYEAARLEFEIAEQLAKKSSDPQLIQATALAELGYNTYLTADNDANKITCAIKILKDAEGIANDLKNYRLSAAIENYLGMAELLKSTPNDPKDINSLYNARDHVENSEDYAIISSIHLNLAKLAIKLSNNQKPDTRNEESLKRVYHKILKTNNKILKTKLLLNYSEQLWTLLPNDRQDKTFSHEQELIRAIQEALTEAYKVADETNQPRLISQASGYLAKLNKLQNKPQEAMAWLDKAIFDAQQAHALDLLMQWEALYAQLIYKEHTLDNADKAYPHYQQAAQLLDDIRANIPKRTHNNGSYLKQIVDPIYRGLADVLLLQAHHKPPLSEEKQKKLKAALESMNKIKKAEMERFLDKDACLPEDATTIDLFNTDELPPSIAVIYPVILPDRIELIARTGLNEQLFQETVNAPIAEVIKISATASSIIKEHKKYDNKKTADQSCISENTNPPPPLYIKILSCQRQ